MVKWQTAADSEEKNAFWLKNRKATWPGRKWYLLVETLNKYDIWWNWEDKSEIL